MVVLGLRTKTHRSLSSVELDYIIHIHEVKPWPPSQSLRTLRAVLIHWEHGDSSTSGFTNQVVPASASDGRIEFNESFGLKMRLMRKVSGDKCVVEFNLYEPRDDMGLKGQLLGSAVLDLAAYGVIKEDLSISIPIHCKRTYRNSAQPLLFLKIEPVEASSSTREKLIMMREASMERTHGGESVSALMSEEYAEEADVASFTTDDDDDVSSHSSLAVTSGTSPPLNKKKETAGLNGSGGGAKVGRVPHQSVHEEEQEATESSSMDLSSDIEWISKRIKSHSLHSSALRGTDKRQSSTNEHHKEEERTEENETRRNHEKYVGEEGREIEVEVLKDYPQVSMQKRMSLGNGVASSTRRNHYATETSRGLISSERKDGKAYRKETRNLVSEGRIQQLEHRIKILEGELREAAGLEVSLYSVVAEHGSSMNKVHAPARRLSRLYFNANKHNPKSGRESASKSVVSGLVSVSKACGNDVPRLTFWLSNTVVLRAIISSTSVGITGMGKGGEKNVKKKWEPSSKITRGESVGEKHKENAVAFVGALEKAEAWIFSRIIESLWWQTFTPRMQSGASIDCNTSKLYRRRTSTSIEQQQQQQQGNFSVELWKKAFRDACERICPVRGGGHADCGCLPLLSKLIMEQVVARLDVAMLNGILRESGDEIPTDPVADPISDANVLPIPAGKASFGAGAHLKNAIGNWSRWLSDLFDMDDENENEDSSSSSSSSSKSPFYLLNALSELMMLPKDMLLTQSIRKQVCPTFGLPLLTRILNSFVPDEFCPDPVPGSLLQALHSQIEQEIKKMQTSINGNRDFELVRNLPRDIAINILSRLSIESIMECKVVCKAWHDLIKSQEFGNYQPQRHRRLIVFPDTPAFGRATTERIYPYPRYEIKESNNNPMPILHIGLSESVPLVRSSVNGLILLLRRQWTEQKQQQHLLLWVCNPMTREYVRIPNPSVSDFDQGLPYPPEYKRFLIPVDTSSVARGAPSREYGNHNFGFGVSRSMQYKVVWISQSQCRVYTLGTTGQWRSIAMSGPRSGLRYNKWNTECAFVGGNLYWLDPLESQTQTEISCFDLETEVFTYLSAPPTREDLHAKCYRSLCAFDGCLCLCDMYGSNGIEIWLMRGAEGGWSKKVVINEEEGVIRNGDFGYGYLYLIKVLEDGNGMLLGDRSRAIIYCACSNDKGGGGGGGGMTKIKLFYPSGKYRGYRDEYPNAAIYTPSFLPLTTLLPDEDVRSF